MKKSNQKKPTAEVKLLSDLIDLFNAYHKSMIKDKSIKNRA